ncbi:hypothetical protein SY88_04975 [Clostridiales bacterium PH28_bin88]|nr:hypothetical protein SY88_04975 [Clostridiales bacterium PH28_bin88]
MMYFGIDLGTTNSLITYWVKIGDNSFDVKPIRNNKGVTLTPSVVYFEECNDENVVVGQSAFDNYDFYPERTIRWVKRDMGKDITYKVDDKTYSPQVISAYILKELKSNAEKDLQMTPGNGIDDIVITVPADFDIHAKQATIDSAKIAGFRNVHLIAEPNAAVLNYIFRTREVGKLEEKFGEGENYYIVFDLGGGTFDVSLSSVYLDETGKPNTSVISSSGDKYLGGINFDLDLMQYVLRKAIKLYPDHKKNLETLLVNAQYYNKTDILMDEDVKGTLSRLIKECEIGKIALSDENKRTFSFISNNGKTFRIEVHRAEFEELLVPYFEKFKKHIERVLKEASGKTNGRLRSWADFQGVLLVGGSTNIPAIKEMCKKIFGQEPIAGIDTFESVGKGAAIYSSIKNGLSDILGSYSTIIPHDYGIIENGTFEPILHRGSKDHKGDYKYIVPFSLDVRAPIQVAQRYYDAEGNDILLHIERINYSHPFLFTGDVLGITFQMDDDLMLWVGVEEECIRDSIEIRIENPIRLTDEEIVRARELLGVVI